MKVSTPEGNITASKALLNDLSLALCEASKRYAEIGKSGLSKHYSELSDIIYASLKENGYYD